MEAMEVDAPSGVQGAAGDAPYVISDSGSSTEVEEDEDDGGQTSAAAPPRLPSTWAFSQRAVGSSAPTNPATQGPPIRRRVRYQEADWRWLEVVLDRRDVLRVVPGRASGFTTPARLQRPLETFQTSCSVLRLLEPVSPSPAAPLRSASLKKKRRRRLLPKAQQTERWRSQETPGRRCRKLRPAVSVSSVEPPL